MPPSTSTFAGDLNTLVEHLDLSDAVLGGIAGVGVSGGTTEQDIAIAEAATT